MKGAMPDHSAPASAPARRLLATALLGALSTLAAPALVAGAEPAALTEPPPEPVIETNAEEPVAPDDPGPAAGPFAGAVAAIAGRVARAVTPLVPGPGNWSFQPTLESALLSEINRMRSARRIPPLLATPILQRPARGHARYLALTRGGSLTHADAQGRPFHRRLVEAGWRARARMSENLAAINACRPQDPRLIVRRWMGSPTHRVNVLDRKVTHAGIGVVSTAGCGMTVYTADFGN